MTSQLAFPASVSLVVPKRSIRQTGINRYVSSLHRTLKSHGIRTSIDEFRFLPGANHRSSLKAFPVGIDAESSFDIAHLTQIIGGSLLLFRRYRNPTVTVHDLGALMCPEDRQAANRVDRLILQFSLRGMRRADAHYCRKRVHKELSHT